MSESNVPMLHVGPGKASDGVDLRQRCGWEADTIGSDLNPKWFERISRGYGFLYNSAAAGVTFAAAGNNLPTIWNPSGSGVLVVPLRVWVGYVSTTNVAGHLAWAFQSSTGSQLGTAAPFSVFTNIAPINALLGLGRTSKVRFSTTQTFTAAPTYLRPVGVNTAAMAAATAVAPFSMTWDEDGGLQLPPGNALQLCANAAIAMVAAVSILALEIPLPPGWEG